MKRLLFFALLLLVCGGCDSGPPSFTGSWVYDDDATRKENQLATVRDKTFWDKLQKSFAPVTITIDLATGTLTYTRPDGSISGPVRLERDTLTWTPEPGREQRYILNKKGQLETDAGGHVLLFTKKR